MGCGRNNFSGVVGGWVGCGFYCFSGGYGRNNFSGCGYLFIYLFYKVVLVDVGLCQW